jgi:solute carrier family 26 (sodium-independent sulfate anion transporter), member 11
VNNVDVTSVQHLIDVRNQLDKYASPDKVDWHFACITNRWTKRAIAAAGFGYLTPAGANLERWKPIFSVAEIGGSGSAAAAAQLQDREREVRQQRTRDAEQADQIGFEAESSSRSSSDLGKELSTSKAYAKRGSGKVVVLQGLNLPLFHIDLTSALQSAVRNVESRVEVGLQTEKLI